MHCAQSKRRRQSYLKRLCQSSGLEAAEFIQKSLFLAPCSNVLHGLQACITPSEFVVEHECRQLVNCCKHGLLLHFYPLERDEGQHASNVPTVDLLSAVLG